MTSLIIICYFSRRVPAFPTWPKKTRSRSTDPLAKLTTKQKCCPLPKMQLLQLQMWQMLRSLTRSLVGTGIQGERHQVGWFMFHSPVRVLLAAGGSRLEMCQQWSLDTVRCGLADNPSPSPLLCTLCLSNKCQEDGTADRKRSLQRYSYWL